MRLITFDFGWTVTHQLVYDHQGRHVPNDAMDRYQNELQRRFESNQLDPFGAYCLGKIWKRANNTQAVSAFLRSISKYPIASLLP